MTWLALQGKRDPCELTITSPKLLPCSICAGGNVDNDVARVLYEAGPHLEYTLAIGAQTYLGFVRLPHKAAPHMHELIR